jgi:septum formation protein
VTASDDLVLASSSPYRRRLLARLQIPFRCLTPNVDETPTASENARSLSLRLAHAKAAAISERHSEALVLASDQTADLDGLVFGKPGDAGRARAQLLACSGKRMLFHTAVVLRRAADVVGEAIVVTEVRLRVLESEEIDRYLEIDEPYDCAGSFRWEGIGIALFDSLRSDDPTALEGLPLITVATMLRRAGLNPLGGGAGA